MNIWLTGLVLLVVGAIGAIAWRRWRSVAGLREPACAKCGYAITQLTTPICPECGSDLRVVGVRVPGQYQWRMIIIELAWLAACLFLSVIILGNTLPLPHLVEWSWNVRLQPQSPTATQRYVLSGAVRAWRIVGPAEMVPAADALPSTITIEALPPNGAARRLIVRLDDQSYAIIAADGTEQPVAAPFDAAAATQWLRSLGVTDVDVDEQGTVLADVVALRLDTDAASAYFDRRFPRWAGVGLWPSGMGHSAGIRSDEWMLRGAITLAVLVWVSAAMLIVHRRRAIGRFIFLGDRS